MARVAKSVGKGQPNRSEDVRTVQILLNRSLLKQHGFTPLHEDGRFGAKTEQAIKSFQAQILHQADPDGIVSNHGPTHRVLLSHATKTVLAKKIRVTAPHLHSVDYVEAARLIDCEPAAIKAVAQTETKRAAFDNKGRPTILFERHKFHAFTGGKYDKSDPDLSNPAAGGYGTFDEQYGKLDRAMKLDKVAALKAASWGAFQIMGENYKEAGYETVESFVDAMKTSEANHLAAFVAFILNSKARTKALQQKNWEEFARHYNGKNYAKNSYDTKMKNNYEQLSQIETASVSHH